MNIYHLFLFLFTFVSILSCTEPTSVVKPPIERASFDKKATQPDTPPTGNTIETRFAPPTGFERVGAGTSSFAAFLRKLPLKQPDAPVHLYDGSLKANQQAHVAVIDLPIGNKNLHQCADAVMRLRADYLRQQKAYDKIHFNFTNGFRVDYAKWRAGQGVAVRGNQTSWQPRQKLADEDQDYWKYMELIFTYAGTLSLEKELQRVPFSDMQIGDVLIQGGSPGHAVIVIDMVVHPDTQEKRFLLAQSYMPAQEIQVLKGDDPRISPWYVLDANAAIYTPEWTFHPSDLRRFGE